MIIHAPGMGTGICDLLMLGVIVLDLQSWYLWDCYVCCQCCKQAGSLHPSGYRDANR